MKIDMPGKAGEAWCKITFVGRVSLGCSTEQNWPENLSASEILKVLRAVEDVVLKDTNGLSYFISPLYVLITSVPKITLGTD